MCLILITCYFTHLCPFYSKNKWLSQFCSRSSSGIALVIWSENLSPKYIAACKNEFFFDLHYPFFRQGEIDILKMDIESDEWKCLRHMLKDGTLKSHVRQLNVEYHISNTTEALRQSYDIVKWLEKDGFKIFHSRKNPHCRKCWELSYVNSNLVNLPLK